MQFTMQSAAAIGKMVEVQVWKGQYYDPSRQPVPDGLLDPRMVMCIFDLIYLL